MENSKRIGFFTSSEISKIVGFESRPMTDLELKKHKEQNPGSRKKNIEIDGFAKPGKTYIQEVFLERSMNRTIDTVVKTQAMKWGNLMEVVLFNLIGLGYSMTHKQTIKHFKYSKFWSGTPDLISKGKKIGEIKCFQPKNFALLSLCLLKKDVEVFKNEFPKEYWQCVSNAILCELNVAEIIAFMPYKWQLKKIIDQIEETNFLEMNGLDPQDYYFMTRNDIESLAYLSDDSPMQNINSFEFEIPKEDIEFLTQRVVDAEKEVQLLIAT